MSENLGNGYGRGEDGGSYTPPQRTPSPEVERLRREVEELRRKVALAEEEERRRAEQTDLDRSETNQLLREKRDLEKRLKK